MGAQEQRGGEPWGAQGPRGAGGDKESIGLIDKYKRREFRLPGKPQQNYPRQCFTHGTLMEVGITRLLSLILTLKAVQMGLVPFYFCNRGHETLYIVAVFLRTNIGFCVEKGSTKGMNNEVFNFCFVLFEKP